MIYLGILYGKHGQKCENGEVRHPVDTKLCIVLSELGNFRAYDYNME